ncbi:hypothetical protein FOZ62_026772, partial [Perkinsus olseni]
ANWIVRGSSLSSYRLLMDAFRTAHDRLPLFGDQDALIWHLTMGTATDLTQAGGRPSFHPRARVIPQGTINAYDALNAHYMACAAFDGPSGHLLVTFPGCRDYRACNLLFAVAHSYSIGRLIYDRDDWAHVRVLGPGERAVEMFERGEDDASITVMNRQKPPAPLGEEGMCPVSYPIHAVNQCAGVVIDHLRMKPSPPTDSNPVTAKEAVEWAVALLRAAGLVEVDIAHFRCLRDSSDASATAAAARGEDILRSACRLAAGGGSPQDYLSGLGYPRLEQLGSAGPASDLEAMRAVLWMVFNEATGLRRRAESTWTPRLPRVIRLLLGLNPQPSKSGLTAVRRPSARPSYPVGSDPLHAILQAANEVTRLDRESASIAAALTRIDYRSPATMPSEKAVKILNPKIAGSLGQYREEISKQVHLAACELKFCDWLRSTTVYRAKGTAPPEVVVVQDTPGEQLLRVMEEEADSLLEDCMCILSSPPYGLHFHKAGVYEP